MVHISPDLMQRQHDLEREMLEASRRRFLKELEETKQAGREDEAPYGKILMRRMLHKVGAGITEYISGFDATGRGRRPVAYMILTNIIPMLGIEVVSYLTLKVCIGTMSSGMTLNNGSVTLGTMLENEVRMAKFRAKEPELATITDKKLSKVSAQHHKLKVASVMAGRAGVNDAEWSKADRLQLGAQLIEIVETTTGMCKVVQRYEGGNAKSDTPYYIEPTNDVIDWVKRCISYNELLEPYLWPTVVPPKPWTGPEDGGYYSKPGREVLRLVKTDNKNYLEELRNADLDRVYEAVNLVQNTPWRINTQVLDVLEKLCEQERSPNGVVPIPQEEPLPARPEDIDTNEEALKEWKKRARMTYERNARSKSKAIQLAMILNLARRFRDEERIYFPHQLDFRGRLYPTCVLSPQGSDLTKALLTFADGKPINDDVALGWLMIHGANSWGADKLPLVDRIGWVEDHEAEIMAVAEDPTENQWWTEADAPWAFLAFCFEYAGFKRAGYGFVSSLPVSVDGSCNGLQHFSAMLRDEVGGRAVNLIPADKPEDIYRRVAEEVTVELRRLSCNDGSDAEMAKRCLALGIDRSITKRSVMIVPYSGTQYSMRDYIEQALREKLDRLGVHEANLETDERNPLRFTDENGNATNGVFATSLFLAKLVWDAIGRVVVAARQAMTWLRKAAQLAGGEGLPVTWTTPDGFPVWQAYRVSEMQRIRTTLYGGIRLVIRQDTKEIDRKKQSSGVSPNFVHSLDAAALRFYVQIASLNDISHFAVVHDSFGTVAADAEMMGRCLREAFIDLYEGCDVLAKFREDVAAMLSPEAREQLPPIPDKGSLDLSLIRGSDFFFA